MIRKLIEYVPSNGNNIFIKVSDWLVPNNSHGKPPKIFDLISSQITQIEEAKKGNRI